MEREAYVTGGSVAGVVVGLAVLLVGVAVGEYALQGVGGFVVLVAMGLLTLYLERL